MRAWAGWTSVALACACARAAPPKSDPAVEVARAEPHSEPPSDAGARPRPEQSLIDEGRVGELRVGQPIPAQFLADDRDARARYEIRWVADAQPLEAFRIGEARVLAVFDGPFTRWAQSNAGELDPARFVEQALRDARSGASVELLVVDAPGPTTAAGIGVGSAYSDLLSAYPNAKLVRLPEWFEPRLTCEVTVPELRRVAFHLSECGVKPPGSVIRVLVSRVEE